MSGECESCKHGVGGACTHPTAAPEYGDCGHYEGCSGWWPKEANDANA